MAADGAGIRFGQYVLLRRIARGGMAEVFLAQQRGLEGFDRRVAVKRILPHLADSPEFTRMFLGEAKLAAQLTHPNIVYIYDFGKVSADYFIAMEYVDGVHAGQLFKHAVAHAAGRLSPTMVARIGADAAMALHYAHELRAANGKPYGLVHRDVSPANLMVSFDGVVKLCDFGIAKAAAIGDQLTLPGHVKGKYAYMSPEQTTGTPLDGRSDVYSLAIVLWELLAGATIVPRGDAVEAMRMIRDGRLAPIERAAPATPPALASAITWALQTDRDQRATALQLALALEAFIKSSPELATAMQLAGWLRAQLPRDADDAASAEPTGGTASVLGTAATPSTPAEASRPDRDDAPTVIAGDHAAFEPTDPPTALRELHAEDPASASGELDAEPGDHAETLMRSGAFRPPVPSAAVAAPTRFEPPPMVPPGPSTAHPRPATASSAARTLIDPRAQLAAARTLIDPRAQLPSASAAAPTLLEPRAMAASAAPPAGAAYPANPMRAPSPMPSPMASTMPSTMIVPPPDMRGSPLTGMPALVHGAPGPAHPASAPLHRRVPRRALAIAGLISLAVLSFVIALAARGTPARPADRAAATAPGPADTATAVTAPPATATAPPTAVTAPVATTAPVDAAPADTRAPTIAPEPTTVVEVRTRPEGGRITLGGYTRASPAQFALPAGHYRIDAELDGWRPEHRALDLVANTRVIQDIVFATRRDAVRPLTGKLTARTTPPCAVYLGARRLTETPFSDLELEPGTYTLQFKHPAHATLTRRVTITAGKTTRLQLTLP